jgi:hypothetical protein
MVQEFKGDSYIVDIIPLAKTAPYPMIYICPRKKFRQKGQVALDSTKERFLPVSATSFNFNNLDNIAREIGRAILNDSKIVQDFLFNRS